MAKERNIKLLYYNGGWGGAIVGRHAYHVPLNEGEMWDNYAMKMKNEK